MTRRETIAPVLLFLAPLLFFSDTLLSTETYFMRDLTYLFHPWRSLSAQMIQGGVMPVWNSYQMGGAPFLANCQSAILYPFTILFSILGFTSAVKIFHVLQYAMAGLGFYLLARWMRFRPWTCLTGAILFAFNGYALTRVEFLSVLGSLIWFPWVLIFSARACRAGSILDTILLGMVLTLSFLGGYPQIFFLQCAGAAVFCMIYAPVRQSLKIWAAAVACFLFLGAAQMIPTMELLKYSIRGGEGIPQHLASSYSLPFQGLLGLLNPHWIPENADRFTGEKFFWIWSGWWGMTATALLFLSFWSRRKRLLWMSAGLVMAGTVWSLGDHLPFYRFFYEHVYLTRLFRYPPAALYWTVTGAALLVLCGLDALRGFGLSGKVKKGLILSAGVLLIFELLLYSRNLYITVTPDYFRVTHPAVRTVLEDRPGTVLLSPKVDRKRGLWGVNDLDAKTRFRGFLFDLTNLPYRIKSIIPSGEPLALQSFSEKRVLLAQAGSFENVKPFLNAWNVTHFLTHDTIEKDWTLLGADRDLRIYRNPGALGEAVGYAPLEPQNLTGENPRRPAEIRTSNGRFFARFETKEEMTAVFNVPVYPGWKMYCAKCKIHPARALPTVRSLGFFQGIHLSEGSHDLHLVYHSTAWRLGLGITCAAIIALAVLGLRRIRKVN